MSRVSNTAGTHGAYLKQFKERATKPFHLKTEETVPGNARSYNSDILHLLRSKVEKYDIFYLDPPYTNRKYAPNYHLYETFARYNDPKIKGKTGLRKDWQKEASSRFCSIKTVDGYFSEILLAVDCDLVVISYSSDGLVPLERLVKMCRGCGYHYY